MKLGLLLYGPPGTGKTSLIKALAERTNRNVVNIPLSRIKTNEELFNLFFDLSFSVKGEDLPVKLQYSDIIFVMEDIDCASRVVHARKPAKSQIDYSRQDDSRGAPKKMAKSNPRGKHAARRRRLQR